MAFPLTAEEVRAVHLMPVSREFCMCLGTVACCGTCLTLALAVREAGAPAVEAMLWDLLDIDNKVRTFNARGGQAHYLTGARYYAEELLMAKPSDPLTKKTVPPGWSKPVVTKGTGVHHERLPEPQPIDGPEDDDDLPDYLRNEGNYDGEPEP